MTEVKRKKKILKITFNCFFPCLFLFRRNIVKLYNNSNNTKKLKIKSTCIYAGNINYARPVTEVKTVKLKERKTLRMTKIILAYLTF